MPPCGEVARGRIAVAVRKRLRGESTSEVTMDTAAERQFREFVVTRLAALMRLAYLVSLKKFR